MRFRPCCSKPALLSSRPVTLVWSLAGSPAKQGQERRRGWTAVQVLRGSQVLLPSGPAPALRPRVGRPSPSRGLRVPSRPPVGSAHRRNASCRTAQEGPALEAGLCPKKKFPGDRYSKRGVVFTERGRGQRFRSREAETRGVRAASSASIASSPGSLSLPSPRCSMAAQLLSTWARPVSTGSRPGFRLPVRGPGEGASSQRVRESADCAPPPGGWGGPRDQRPASAPPPHGWGGHGDHRPHAAADGTQPIPGFLHTVTSCWQNARQGTSNFLPPLTAGSWGGYLRLSLDFSKTALPL